ncbi:hypothetical protein ONE63_004504 [Megalurothrips usitatus]|uniref:F-box domain-containing protein n=1 Tax=Megalurothrips usitatus TaxID=439358 RepID=A0AAV7X9X7_9NEOP|nr:hypothetical protein ONE63_004504 [Megalurothrips usitatus]
MSMDALPDELLLHVFAMVTPEQDDSRSTLRLLQLRAVSRRWRRLLQSPAAWRHRRLSLVVTQHALGCGAPALRLLPALHTLRLFLDYGSSRESRAVVQDLAASQCQVSRGLRLKRPATIRFAFALEHDSNLWSISHHLGGK